MKSSLRILTFLFLSVYVCAVIYSCKKEVEASGTDKELYEMVKVTTGFTWYKHSSTPLNKSTGSGHAEPMLRVRYNAIAAAKLDSTGKTKPGTTFPEGSLIVKELNKDATTLVRYAILYKQSANVDADPKGWVWATIYEDGSVAEPASHKGMNCINCHSQSGSIDYMLMNKFFP